MKRNEKSIIVVITTIIILVNASVIVPSTALGSTDESVIDLISEFEEALADLEKLTKAADEAALVEFVKQELPKLRVNVEQLTIPQDIKNSLLVKLDNALNLTKQASEFTLEGREEQADNMLVAASNVLHAFVNEVKALSEKKIPKEEANSLVKQAQTAIGIIKTRDIKKAIEMLELVEKPAILEKIDENLARMQGIIANLQAMELTVEFTEIDGVPTLIITGSPAVWTIIIPIVVKYAVTAVGTMILTDYILGLKLTWQCQLLLYALGAAISAALAAYSFQSLLAALGLGIIGAATVAVLIGVARGVIFKILIQYLPICALPKLIEQWSYGMAPRYWWGWFGSSAAIADLGPDVNKKGTEPNSDLEIVIGSDGYWFYSPELGKVVPGLWRAFDSQGNVEWATSTESDEARSSPAIADIDGDGDLEIAAGTTSGWCVEVMSHTGSFVWTFPYPPVPGAPFLWPSSPAVVDVDPSISGLEVIIGNWYLGSVWAFDGDNSDGINDGITADTSWYPYSPGTEGKDWDVLWTFQTGGGVASSPAIGDVDNDGVLEVVIGSTDGKVYVLNGINGGLEYTFSTGAVYASAAISNLDADSYLEIVIGSTDGKIYCFQWDGKVAKTEWIFSTGAAVYSSASIGDVDGDGSYEVVVGSTDGKIYCLSSSGSLEWSYSTGGAIYSSAALANRGTKGLGIYIGSNDKYLYLLSGTGSLIGRFLTYGEIRTSPAVADIDGDGILEVIFYDWSSTDTLWCIEDILSEVSKYSIEWPMFRSSPSRTGVYQA